MVIQLNKYGQARNLNVLMSKSSKGCRENNLFGNKRCTIYCDIKKGMVKMYLLLKLIQVPWSIKTMLDLCLLA